MFQLVYTRHIRSLGLKGTERTLDFGSGSGACSRHLTALLQKDGHLTCVDTSHFMPGKARKRLGRYANIDFQVGELPELGLPEKSFDVVFVHYALHEVSPARGRST
ncbi:MAG: class I SAM-dependent methyltransferase [Syntrophothermus sp.]